mgnify:FL=1
MNRGRNGDEKRKHFALNITMDQKKTEETIMESRTHAFEGNKKRSVESKKRKALKRKKQTVNKKPVDMQPLVVSPSS